MESYWYSLSVHKNKRKKRDTKENLHCKKRRNEKLKKKKNEKPKKYMMKNVVAKIRMKEDGPKRCHMPKLCALLVF